MPFEIAPDAVPVGSYVGSLLSVTITKSTNPLYPDDQREWLFLLDVAGVATEMRGWTSLNTSPSSNANKWLTALLRRPLLTGEKLEDPIGQRVTVVVGLNKNGKVKITDLAPIAEVEQVVPGVPR